MLPLPPANGLPARGPLRLTSRARRLATIALALGAGWALSSSIGCNGILGIDERTLAEDTSGLSCQNYCDAIQTACTAEFQEYQTPEACIATCEAMTLGTLGDTGNTIGCRMKNVQLAGDTGELGDYCPISGPLGGGNCGDRCENFCALFVPHCASFSAVTDQAGCIDLCQTSPDNAVWDPRDPEQKDYDASLQCRAWHLSNALLDPTLHCNHADGTTKCDGSISGATSSSSSSSTGGTGGGGEGGSGGGG
jgi:hypothetical protein